MTASVRSTRWRLESARRALLALTATVGVVSCSGGDARRPEDPLAGLDTSTMEPRVAERLEQAHQAALAEPESAGAWGRLGAVCDAHDLYELALPCYERAGALAPEDFRWTYLVACLRQLQGAEVAEVARLFQDAARLAPDFPPVHYRLGEALLGEGLFAQARVALTRALELDPSLAIAHQSLGQLHVATGEAEAALEHLEQAQRGGVEDGRVMAAMAQAYFLLGDVKRAEAAAERSRRLPKALALPDPVRYEVELLGISTKHCYERAERAILAGDHAKAIEQLEIVEEQRPDAPEVQYRLGICLARTGRAAEAIPHLQRAVQLDPALPEAHAELAAVLAGTGRTGEAIGHYRQAVRLAPGEGRYRATLATVLARSGALDEAIALFEEAAAQGTENATIHHDWGTALLQRKDLEEAIDHFREAVKRRPQYLNAIFKLGYALEQVGRVEEALDAYRQAVRVNPAHPAAQRLAELEKKAKGD